jgi:oligoendopeptidase F
MDSRDLSQVELLVELVGDKINAQVAAHEKYSQAFIKILDTLDTIIEQQEEITSGDTTFYKKLIEEINDLYQEIKKDDDLQKEWRDSMLIKMDNLQTSNSNQIKELQKNIEKSIESSNQSFQSLNEKIAKITEKVEKIEESNSSNHSHINTQLDSILESRKKITKTFEKVLIYIAAIGTIIGLIMGLMQLNLLTIHWGPK